MDFGTLQKYQRLFATVRRHRSKEFGLAPHKPVLLLAVLDEVERGNVQNNTIALTPSLMMTFQEYWRLLTDPRRPAPRIAYPFRRLHQDGFWEFTIDDEIVTPDDGDYSVERLKEEFDGARFPPDLWTLLQDNDARNILRTHVMQTFFQTDNISKPQIDALFRRDTERLMSEAEAKFRPKQVREAEGDWYYIRHALFPQVIKNLYQQTCAVCRLDVRLPSGVHLIEAAHILPFAQFHNDDPRNGIALCKNHHAGFDTGMFSLNDDYTVLLNPLLQNFRNYLAQGKQILLPEDPQFYPDLAAIQKHRNDMLGR